MFFYVQMIPSFLLKMRKTFRLLLMDYVNTAKKWCLKVNTAKAKIIVFARGKVRKYPKFQLGSNEIEVVEQYVYLGILFNYNGSFKKAIDKQITQARKKC